MGKPACTAGGSSSGKLLMRGEPVLSQRAASSTQCGRAKGGEETHAKSAKVSESQFNGASRDTSRGTKQSELVESARVGEACAR
jgi:hypothetical protein